MDWRDAGLVAAGAVAGALVRFGASSLVPGPALPWTGFPWATLAVNLAGSFVLGLLMLGTSLEHPTRLLVAVGFLGSLTTLSTYSFETVELWRSGLQGRALANVAANGLGGPLMALLGWRLRVGVQA